MPEDSNKKHTVLVTGGTGYIGSHIVVELLEAGYDVVVVDNLSNSDERVLGRIRLIVGEDAFDRLTYVMGDVCDDSLLRTVFTFNPIDAVIHCAGYKAVGESVSKPIEYYENNIGSTLTLLRVMREFGCDTLIFSSSATVYCADEHLPIPEEDLYSNGMAATLDDDGQPSRMAPPASLPSNPYGWTKWMQERVLEDAQRAGAVSFVIPLRYANPIGAHPSGLIGEAPNGIPNNLLPYVAQVAVGRRDHLSVFGDDYDTPDGTAVRDYIHVMDLAKGHVAAVRYVEGMKETYHSGGCFVSINMSTGKGTSVLDVVKAFSKACGHDIPYKVEPRRAGDVAAMYLDPSKAERLLGWKATRGIDEMCQDAWRWQSGNPDGYASKVPTGK